MSQAFRVACLFFPPEARSNSDPQAHLQEISRIAEVCLRWTPQIAVSDNAIFLEIGKCRGLYHEDSLRLKLQVVARKFGCAFRVAIASDAPSALARSCLALGQGGNEVSDEELPIETLMHYADPFGADSDGVKPVHGMIRSLRKLGVTSIGEFLRLPSKSLPSRFGKLGILLHQRIREAALIPWPRFFPKERILEKSELEDCGGFQELEPLLFVLKPSIDRTMIRLRGRGEQASSVRLRIWLEKHSHVKAAHREWRFDLARPQGSSLGLIAVLRERLSLDLERDPLPSLVTGFEIEILETAPGRGAQRDLFHAREEEIEAWNSWVARLSEKLGMGKVFRAEIDERYLPEKAWSKTLEVGNLNPASSDESDGADQADEKVLLLPERPLRLLKIPLAMVRSGSTLIPAEWQSRSSRSPRDRRSCRNWKILGISGPEVICSEWWFRQCERRYFSVTTESGERLWIFQRPGSDTFYLHGFFD